MRVRSEEINARTGSRRKTLLWPILIGVPVLALLGWMLLNMESEPLSSKEILAKQKWTERELSDALARSFSPQGSRDRRREVLAHLRDQLGAFPEETQKRIRIDAMTGAMRESLRQMRAMPEAEQDKLIEAIHERARKGYEDSLTREGRERLDQLRDSEEGQALNQEITRMVLSDLTPEERRKFAPVTELWTKTMRLP